MAQVNPPNGRKPRGMAAATYRALQLVDQGKANPYRAAQIVQVSPSTVYRALARRRKSADSLRRDVTPVTLEEGR